MEKHTIHTKGLSRLLQLFDGSFPSGAFVHSFGLEPHIVLKKVTDIGKLEDYLKNLIIDQYQNMDFVFVKKVYSALEQGKLSLLIKEDKNFYAMLPHAYAKASINLGQNYLKQINFDIQKPIVKNYFDAIQGQRSKGNELSILSAYAFELGISVDLFLLVWCKKNIISIAMSSLKISRIKPSEIQRMLFSFDEKLASFIANSMNSIHNFNPLFEEIIYQHDRVEPKLFVT